MIEPTTLARPYARAAFEHARASDQLAAWQAALSQLATITTDAKVSALRDPNQTAAQRASPHWRLWPAMNCQRPWVTCWALWPTTADWRFYRKWQFV